MWSEAGCGWEAAELVRAALPYWLLVTLPVLLLVAPEPAAAAHEFAAYRMLQHDLHGVAHGCRSSSVSLEGRSLSSWSTSRHCVLARLQDLTVDRFLDIRSRAGALLLVLPRNQTQLSADERQHIQHLESAMSQQEVPVPVYLVPWSPETEGILEELEHSFITDEKSATALEAMVNTASASGYQIVVSAAAPSKLESRAVTLHSKLAGRASNAQTIVVAAHYDATAIAPELAVGSDSNASGAAALLELARIFSKLYAAQETRPAASLLFLLSGAGHSLNYFSTKKWLEEQLDSPDGLLQEVAFAMCVESVSAAPELRMHVSKPPRAGGAAASLQARLAAPLRHKKINLADETLAWQHERFSIRRMTAFTLSSLESHKDPSRGSILDTPSEQAAGHLVHNVERLARALASHLYNLTAEDDDTADAHLYSEVPRVDAASLRHWYEYLSSQSRAAHIITTTSATGPSGVSAALERALSRYAGEVTVSVHSPDKREPEYALYSPTRATLHIYSVSAALERALSRYAGEVTVSVHSPDKREPEYALYSPTRATLHIYSVKPAVFDLVLTLGIAAYLALLYLAIVYFPVAYEELARRVAPRHKQH